MFNPADDMINWQSLIDIKNYDDSYTGEEKRHFCNWTSEEITLFNKKLNLLKFNDKDKEEDKEKVIESIKDIIDFGLNYQDDFFNNYKKSDYYYKLGLEKLIPKIDKMEKSLDQIIDELKNENKKEKNKFNNCLNEESQFRKIKVFISKVNELCNKYIDKNKEDIKSEIKEWAKKCKEYYKNNPNINNIEEEDENEEKKEINDFQRNLNKAKKNNNEIKQQIDSNIRNHKISKNDFAERLSIFDNNIQKPKIENTAYTNPQKQKQKKEPKKDKAFSNIEILAYINLGFKCIFDYTLRFTQLISLYILITKKKNLGRIIQVLTGEGKTCIIIGLAIYHVLKNHKVDIVTSNGVLAKRDSTDSKHKIIYDLFNIKIDHCISSKDDTSNKKNCYNEDIDVIYGDTHNFQADFLHENYYSENVKNGRKEDIIIIDEIDSMLVDEYAKSTLLAGQKPYMKSLTPILYYIYYYLKKILENDKNSKKIITKKESENLKKTLINIGAKIINGWKEQDDKGKEEEVPAIPLPPYLKEYALNELETWAKNAICAYTLEKEVPYTLKEGKIVPVDNENTGVIQNKSTLSSGLHQFLEIKEECKITPINIITNFQSNYGFFNLYKKKECNNIYGLTGTLGSMASKTLLKKIYDLDFAFIPPFYQRKLEQLCPRLENSENWINTIMKTSIKAVRNNRVVLIICRSRKLVDELETKFKDLNPNLNIKKLKDDEQANNREDYNNLPPGFIIIATNIAGRGMDINLSKDVIQNYGLHVCLTFIPRNERVQEQNFGRAGRKGEPGTYQIVCDIYQEITEIKDILFNETLKKQIQKIFRMNYDLNNDLGKALFPSFIINKEDLEKKQNSNKNDTNQKDNKKEIKSYIKELKDLIKEKLGDIPINYEKLILERNKKEEKELDNVNKEINKIKLKDKLFNHYLEFIRKKELQKNKFLFRDIEEQWGLWLNRITNRKELNSEKECVNEFENWIKRYNNDNEIHYENDAYLCFEIQQIFQKNNFIHDYSESILRELCTDFANFFGKNKADKLKIESIKERLNNCVNKSKNHTNFIFFYYLGISQILLKDKKNGLNSLQKAKELIIKEYNYLVNFYLNSNSYKLLEDYILNMIMILYSIEQKLISPVIEYINKNKNFKLKKTTLDIYFSDTEKLEDHFEELKDKGFYIIFVPEKSTFAIISFVTKFFSKLFLNLKQKFGSLTLANETKESLINKIKNFTNNKDNYNWQNDESLNFLKKINICFYKTLYQPNLDQEKLIKKPINEQKCPLFAQLMRNCKEEHENFMKNELNEINPEELAMSIQDLNNKLKELDQKMRIKYKELIKNDENYNSIQNDLLVSNYSKEVLVKILLDSKEFEFKDDININFDNIDNLSDEYSKKIHQSMMQLYSKYIKDIQNGILDKFFEVLTKIIKEKKAEFDKLRKEFHKQKKVDDEKKGDDEQSKDDNQQSNHDEQDKSDTQKNVNNNQKVNDNQNVDNQKNVNNNQNVDTQKNVNNNQNVDNENSTQKQESLNTDQTNNTQNNQITVEKERVNINMHEQQNTQANDTTINQQGEVVNDMETIIEEEKTDEKNIKPKIKEGENVDVDKKNENVEKQNEVEINNDNINLNNNQAKTEVESEKTNQTQEQNDNKNENNISSSTNIDINNNQISKDSANDIKLEKIIKEGSEIKDAYEKGKNLKEYSDLIKLKQDKSNPILNQTFENVFAIDPNILSNKEVMSEIEENYYDNYMKKITQKANDINENKVDEKINLVDSLIKQDGNAFSKRYNEKYRYSNYDFLLIGRSIVNENKKNLNCKYVFLNYYNLVGEENIFLGNYKKDNILITFIYIKDRNILLYLECSEKSDKEITDDKINEQFKEKLNINGYELKKNKQFENSSENKNDEIICLNALEYFLKLEEGEKRDNFINTFESLNFKEIINEEQNQENKKKNNPKYYIIEVYNILKNKKDRYKAEVDIQEIYFINYFKNYKKMTEDVMKIEKISNILMGNDEKEGFREDYIKIMDKGTKSDAERILKEMKKCLKEKLTDLEKKEWEKYLEDLGEDLNENCE